jgi:hypothetical protein
MTHYLRAPSTIAAQPTTEFGIMGQNSAVAFGISRRV